MTEVEKPSEHEIDLLADKLQLDPDSVRRMMTDGQIVEALEGQKQFEARINESVSRRAFSAALLMAGRNENPQMLKAWWEDGLLTPQELPALLSLAWTGPEFPVQLGIKWWVGLFRTAGFVSDRLDVPRPGSVLTVYRGCLPTSWRSLSWTTDFDRAKWFAGRFKNPFTVVYKAQIPPKHILAMFYDRQENEVVVNPWRLRSVSRLNNRDVQGL